MLVHPRLSQLLSVLTGQDDVGYVDLVKISKHGTELRLKHPLVNK